MVEQTGLYVYGTEGGWDMAMAKVAAELARVSQTNRESLSDIERERERERQTDRQAGRQAGRQTDRQTNRQEKSGRRDAD